MRSIAFRCAVLLSVAFAAAPLAAQQREVINRPGTTPNPNAVLSNAIKIGNMMWISGGGGETTGDFEHEARTALERLHATLVAGGFEMKDVVAVQVYLLDAKDFQKMNEVYRTFFPDAKPTRTTVVVAALVGQNMHIEITATAHKAP